MYSRLHSLSVQSLLVMILGRAVARNMTMNSKIIRFLIYLLHALRGWITKKKSFIIHLWEKLIKHKVIIMSWWLLYVYVPLKKLFIHKVIIIELAVNVCFQAFSVKRKENDLDRKYMLLGGPAENAYSNTISQIQQNWWYYFIYKH